MVDSAALYRRSHIDVIQILRRESNRQISMGLNRVGISDRFHKSGISRNAHVRDQLIEVPLDVLEHCDNFVAFSAGERQLCVRRDQSRKQIGIGPLNRDIAADRRHVALGARSHKTAGVLEPFRNDLLLKRLLESAQRPDTDEIVLLLHLFQFLQFAQ